MNKLLSRDVFKQAVFSRDNNKCIFCKNPAVDAHHIIERRLWPDGGYYIDNGVSVCEIHHLLCEKTDISVEEIRIKANITRAVVPPHMYPDQIYDKWGNPILQNGTRMKGELFNDSSVQKILKDKLILFNDLVKYPRTPHLPWSLGKSSDDFTIDSSFFENKDIIVNIKYDGENTTLYNNNIHSRSLDSKSHHTQSWVRNYWSKEIRQNIPDGWRICGENLYGKHSIYYQDLRSYFYGFSIWDENNICLSWNDTKTYFEVLGIEYPEILYEGKYDEKNIKSLWPLLNQEGYVLRLRDSFHFSKFKTSVAKFVRKDHVLTQTHWRWGNLIEKNKLRT